MKIKSNKASAKHNHMLQQAFNLHQSGRLPEAAQLYKKLLQAYPNQPPLLTNLGTIALQQGNHQEGISLLGKSLAIDPKQANAHFNQGVAWFGLNKLDEALTSFDQVISLNPNYLEAYNNRGNVLQGLKKFKEAVASYDAAISLKPDYAQAYSNRGTALRELQQFAQAIRDFEQGIALNPRYAEAYNNRGLTLQDMNSAEAAMDSYRKALELKPDYAEAHYNLGNAFQTLKQFDAAVASYDKALSLKPDYVEAYNNRGNVLKELQQFDAALRNFDQAIALKSNHAEAHNNRGIVLKELGRLEEALVSYERAIAINPDYTRAYSNHGIALQELKRLELALASYDKAMALDAELDFLQGQRLQLKLQICDWQNLEQEIPAIRAKIQAGKPVTNPFTTLAIFDEPALQRQAAEIGTEIKFPAKNVLPKIGAYAGHDKIRLGYFSADFRNHPVSLLTAELFETHDRQCFEIIAFAFGPDKQDEMTSRLQAAFDRFIDVRQLADQAVVLLARQLEIDIAIDLGGHTNDSRTGIFAMRVAPVQVSYIGYPGTMGADYMDYIIADAVLVPEAAQADYVEKLAYLPCFQANDTKRQIAENFYTRQQLGLPEDGFVFCCFNNSYKITPAVFAAWVRILNSVPNSVLFLYAENDLAEKNLQKAANAAGLAADRLFFGKILPLPEYLARFRLADLFLDTLPYNAGTTASDALWAGLPVLTCVGNAFAGRMAASLLTAIGLPELIAANLADYEAMAIDLGGNPEKLAGIKAKLAANRLTTALFDIRGFTGHIEAAYLQMQQRCQAGLPPANIDVKRIDDKAKG